MDYFPHSSRDDFSQPLSLFQYDWLWNIGDRTALTSTAWYDPESGGPREWTIGAYVNRTDRTNFYFGYRQIDPLSSKAVTAAVTYIFSPKYAMTASSTYDFGTSEAMSNSLVFTRLGSDMQVSLGVSYNALQSNFGVLFEIVPNLVPLNKRPACGRRRRATAAFDRALIRDVELYGRASQGRAHDRRNNYAFRSLTLAGLAEMTLSILRQRFIEVEEHPRQRIDDQVCSSSATKCDSPTCRRSSHRTSGRQLSK